MDASIIISGAGPVGTCLAIDAALRAHSVIVLEARSADTPPDAKCNTIAARTMETFRRFGIADQVRAAGLPDDYPTDTVYAASAAGPEFTRIVMPSRSERSTPGFHDSTWPSPERMVRQSQLYLEPILREKLRSLANVQFLPDTELTGFTQDADSVTVQCRSTKDGADSQEAKTFDLTAHYLAGCDGGSSRVRKLMGVRLQGDGEISRTRTSLLRSAEIRNLYDGRRPAWMTWIGNKKVKGNLVAIDGEELWLAHRALPTGETDFESIDADQSIRDLLGVGPDFGYEVVHHQDWVGRRLVARTFRDGRVFLAGDAAHLWVPFAGYGMNAGIADAVNLSWLLCAVLDGWADPGIIDAYEAERQPITEQVSQFAMANMQENFRLVEQRSIPSIVSSPGVIGKLVRRTLGKKLFAMNLPQMSPEGLNFGYYYEGSPIIRYDGESAPDYDMGTHVPSTVPGCRLPHFTVDGESILDLLGPGYTLIRFDGSVDMSTLSDAASASDVSLPLKVVDAPRPAQSAYRRHALVLTRADSHVVWRGDALPENLGDFLDRLRGVTA